VGSNPISSTKSQKLNLLGNFRPTSVRFERNGRSPSEGGGSWRRQYCEREGELTAREELYDSVGRVGQFTAVSKS
jgi:hypothetical protein